MLLSSLDGLVNLVLVGLEDVVHLAAVLGVEHLATQDRLHDGAQNVCRSTNTQRIAEATLTCGQAPAVLQACGHIGTHKFGQPLAGTNKLAPGAPSFTL